MNTKRQVLFVQGGGAGAHDEWDSKLVDSLGRALGPDHEIRYPRMPDEESPRYPAWKAAIERELATLDDGAIVVGHSIGATMLINALAERPSPRRLGAILLIAAPFVGEGGWPSDELKPPPDLGARLPPGVPVHLFHGLEDETAPPGHADLYARAIPQARNHRLAGRDHQLNDDLREVAAAISGAGRTARRGTMTDTQGAEATRSDFVLYAKVWPRMKATLIDGLILALAFVAAASVGANVAGWGAGAFLVWLAFWALYDPVLVSRTGATVGHRLQNLRVVSDRTGGHPSLPVAFIRNVVKGVFGVISLLAMVGSARKKALHDWLAGTTVQARDVQVARLRNFSKVNRARTGAGGAGR
jgi:uncharacterized RDD family membrane protein YckC/predicted alpha/beta hydrolase family esterase